jgi:hypothetical protein
VKRIIYSSLNGINGTIFAFGQTNSGKTHTLVGKEFVYLNLFRKIINKKGNKLHERLLIKSKFSLKSQVYCPINLNLIKTKD